MNKRYSHLAALMLAAMVLYWPTSLWAQSSPNAWRTYNRFDGLAGNWFYDIVQTKDAIWVASDEGIARFNGVWQTFTSDPEAPQGAVRALAVDAQGQLWAVAATGLARYDDQWETTAAKRGLPDTNVLSLLEGPNGQLWAGTDAGVFVLPAGQKQWKAMKDSPVGLRLLVGKKDVWASDGSRLFLWRDAHWQRLPLLWGDKEFSIHITTLASDGEQGVWLGTEQTGLLHVAADGALQAWYRRESSALPSDYVTSLFLAEDGALWVGFNGGGVGILHDEQWLQLTNVDGLAADFVTALFQDADGIFWFGTVAGISRYDSQSWQRWSEKDNAPEAIVTSFSHDPAGYLWITTHGQGLFRFDGHGWDHFSASTEPHDQALSQFLPADYFDLVASDANQFLPTNFLEASYIDQQGALWLGTSEAGVLRYAEGELSQWTMEDGLASDTVVAIAQTPDGVMWFATYRQGLSRWDGSDWQTLTTAADLLLDSVQALLVDSQGRLWLGSEAGVAMFDGQRWQSYMAGPDGPAVAEVMDIAEAPDGSLWFATWGGGVNRFYKGEWTTYAPQDGLLAPGVEAVWTTGNLVWFGTVSGLSLYDGRSWQAFGRANGYEVGRIYALADDREGVYLGTAHGVFRFRPDHTPPQVLIQAVNGHAPDRGTVEITPTESVRITVLGTDMLTDSDQLAYLYKLEGADTDWRFGRTPFITYPPLTEGRYHFSVQARDASMNYSEPVKLVISVRTRPAAILLPGFGMVQSEYALAGVALLTLVLMLLSVSVWNILARLAMRRKVMERRFNPYVAGSPIRDEKMFFGRQALLNDIEATLYHNNLIIHGERRIGKTSLLYQIQRRLLRKRDPEYRFIPILIDLEGGPEEEFFHRLCEGVLEAVADSVVAPTPAEETLFYHRLGAAQPYTDRHFRRDLRTIIAALQQHLHRQPRLIFLLDEADILSTYDSLTQQQFRRILQDSFSQNIGVVLTGVRISKAWDRVESPWFNMFVEIAIKPLNRQEAEQLIREPVAGFYEWDDDAIIAIWKKSRGRPHLIQQICLESVNIMLDHNRHHITLNDVRQASEGVLGETHN